MWALGILPPVLMVCCCCFLIQPSAFFTDLSSSSYFGQDPAKKSRLSSNSPRSSGCPQTHPPPPPAQFLKAGVTRVHHNVYLPKEFCSSHNQKPLPSLSHRAFSVSSTTTQNSTTHLAMHKSFRRWSSPQDEQNPVLL